MDIYTPVDMLILDIHIRYINIYASTHVVLAPLPLRTRTHMHARTRILERALNID